MSEYQNKSREQVQSIALDILKKTNTNGTLDITMRVGKTKIALQYCQHFLSKNPGKKVLWLVDNVKEKEMDLPEESKKWGISLSDIDIIHPRSIHKTTNQTQYGLVIFNECQNITDNLCGYLHGFKHARIIGMTGTYPKYEKAKLLKELGLNRILYTYTIDRAAKNDVISDYTINVVEIPLDKDKNVSVSYTDSTGDKKQFMTSELSSYVSLSYKIDQAKTYQQEKFARLNRMRAVSKFDSKVSYCKKLLVENAKLGLKTLVFAIDNEHAKKIGKYIYNSHTDDKYLEDFNNGRIPYLILVNKGGTGYTYETPIDVIILLAPNSSNTILQKIGRGTINNKENDLNVIIPISKDTVQKNWVTKALSDINQSKIKFKSYA